MVKCTGRGLVVKRPGALSKVQMLNLVLGVGVFSLLPKENRKNTKRFVMNYAKKHENLGCLNFLIFCLNLPALAELFLPDGPARDLPGA